MEPSSSVRRTLLTLTLGLATIAMGLALPERAEAQGRMRVLVPTVPREEPGRGNFGRDIAQELSRQLNDTGTHVAVDRRDFQDAIRQFGVRENEIDCTTARQLAMQMEQRSELVVCGTWMPADGRDNRVNLQFVEVRTGEAFDVGEVVAANPRDAAQQVFAAFNQYNEQVRRTQFCAEAVGTQNWTRAHAQCNEALALNPQSERALYGLARTLMEMDSIERSLELHRQVLEMNPGNDHALLTAGLVAARLNLRDESRDYFNQYLELNPGDAQVRLTVATDLAQEGGDALGALRIAEEGLQEEPDHLGLKEYAGHFALRAAQDMDSQTGAADGGQRSPEAVALYEKALEYYRAVLDARGEEADPDMLRRMMATLAQLQRHEEAVELGASIVAVVDDNPMLWSVYGDALARAGRNAEAAEAFGRVRDLDPEYERINARLARAFLNLDRIEDAARAFRTAIERNEIQSEDAARTIFAYGNNEKFRHDLYDEAYPILQLAAELAETDATCGGARFFMGFIRYREADRIAQAQTLASAQRSLPIFRQAMEHLRHACVPAFLEEQPQIRSQYQQVVGAVTQQVEIQQLLIERGSR